MRCHPLLVLTIVLAGCGDRTIEPRTCGDIGTPPQFSASTHAECKGNTGCTQKTPQCGCHCATCENELCISVLCDDSCQPHCPSVRPESASACSSPSLTCEYTIEPCPCGPTDVKWNCICDNGKWACARGYDCYPCMDGRKDAGSDARHDGAPTDFAQKKDQQPQLDQKVEQPKVDAPCTVPSYPSDCAGVSHFDCGFSATCSGNQVKATWHEHVFCGPPPEQIISFSCTTTCPNGCNASATGWPQNGADLLKQYCN
jgi:hypothetical protein